MIAVVTDSTCDVRPGQARGFRVVPLTVRFDDEQFQDGVDIDPDAFYSRLESSSLSPSTSQPSPDAFAKTYKELLDGGAEGVVSVHISSELSGTYQSATLAAQEFGGQVLVVDTRSVSGGLHLAVEAAVKAAQASASLESVARVASDTAARGGLYVLVDTLTYLQRGGRIGKAQAFVGGILNFKPIVQLRDGVVHPESRVRSRAQGLARLCELVSQAGPIEAATIMHARAPELVEELRPRIQELAGPDVTVNVGEIGPVVGTYSGPGAIGVVFVRSP